MDTDDWNSFLGTHLALWALQFDDERTASLSGYTPASASCWHVATLGTWALGGPTSSLLGPVCRQVALAAGLQRGSCLHLCQLAQHSERFYLHCQPPAQPPKRAPGTSFGRSTIVLPACAVLCTIFYPPPPPPVLPSIVFLCFCWMSEICLWRRGVCHISSVISIVFWFQYYFVCVCFVFFFIRDDVIDGLTWASELHDRGRRACWNTVPQHRSRVITLRTNAPYRFVCHFISTFQWNGKATVQMSA